MSENTRQPATWADTTCDRSAKPNRERPPICFGLAPTLPKAWAVPGQNRIGGKALSILGAKRHDRGAPPTNRSLPPPARIHRVPRSERPPKPAFSPDRSARPNPPCPQIGAPAQTRILPRSERPPESTVSPDRSARPNPHSPQIGAPAHPQPLKLIR
jgi:hypothetical protein